MKMFILRTLSILIVLIFITTIPSPAQSLFVDITDSSGLNVTASHGISLGDYDNDSDLDLIVASLQLKQIFLFENRLNIFIPLNNWLQIDLIGTKSKNSDRRFNPVQRKKLWRKLYLRIFWC